MSAAVRTPRPAKPAALLLRIPLRWRLLSVGLMCAALTGLCGGVAILSLRQIHGSMRETTERISANIATQYSCAEEAFALRALVDAIDSAADSEALVYAEQRFRRLRAEWTLDVGAELSGIPQTLSEFMVLKRRQLDATAELTSLRRSGIATLADIAALTLNVVDDAEFDTAVDIDGAVAEVRQQSERMSGATDQAQAATRAAFSLRSACQEIAAGLNKLRLTNDKAQHNRLHEETRTLLQDARRALAELPPGDATTQMAELMQELAQVVESMLHDCERHDASTEGHRQGAVCLTRQQQRSDALLAEITALALTTQDDTESDSALLVGNATDGIRDSCDHIARITEQALGTVKAALDVRANCNQLHAMVKGMLMSTDPAEVRYRQSEMVDLLELTRRELTLLPKSEMTSRMSEVLGSMESLVGRLFAAKEQMLSARAGLDDVHRRIREQMEEMDRAVLQLANGARAAAERQLQASRAVVSRWQGIELLLVLVAFGLSVVLGAVTSVSVARQIQALNSGIRIVGAGNWDHRVDTGADDEIGQLSRAFDRMTESLRVREEALKRSEERAHTVIAANREAMLTINQEGEITIFNPAAEEMFGRPAGEMIGRSFDSLLPQDLRHSQSAVLQGLLATGSSVGVVGETVEVKGLRCNGEQFPLELALSVSGQGEGRFVLGVLRDITQRRQAEEEVNRHIQEITESKRRLEVLVSNTTEREKRMIALKQEVNDLLGDLGRQPKYEAPGRVAQLATRAGMHRTA